MTAVKWWDHQTEKEFGMKRVVHMLTVGAGLVLGMATAAVAGPLVSGSGSATCELNAAVFGSSDCALQTITAHGAWQQAGAGSLIGSEAQWVSYANTGVSGGNELAPIPTTTSATPDVLTSVPWLLKVTEQFFVGENGGIDFKVWADDTADVYLNGVLKKAATYSQDTCAGDSIGCEPHEYFQLSETLSSGFYTLDFFVYQLGNGTDPSGNPFGLIYGGEVYGDEIFITTNLRVPAPAGLALLLPGLMALYQRRRTRS